MREFRVNFKRLKASKYASLMTRLAMVVNDLTTISTLLDLGTRHKNNPSLKNSDPMLRELLGSKQFIEGFQLYAFRMMVGHFCEGMKIIKCLMDLEEAGDKEFSRYLIRLKPEVEEDYKFLKSLWIKQSPDEKKFKVLMQNIRHSPAFHYEAEDNHTTKALMGMGEVNESSISSFIQGRYIYNSRFTVADAVTLHAIFDSIWEVMSKDEQETTAKIDERMAWCGKQRDRLFIVGFELCSMYFSENSV